MKRGDTMATLFSYSDRLLRVEYKHDEHPSASDFHTHTHESYELFYFAGGSGIYRVEGTPYPLEPGDLLLMRPAESHYIDITADTPYTRFTVNFSPALFAELDPERKLLRPFDDRKLGTLNRYRVDALSGGSVFMKNLTADSFDRRLQTVTNLLPLLNELGRAFGTAETEAAAQSLDSRIIRHINRHIFEPVSLDGLAAHFYISKAHLCRIFKSATGSTVGEYITAKRLVSVRRLIADGTPPTRAYLQCGFKDYSAFYRAYKKHYGVSPSDASCET